MVQGQGPRVNHSLAIKEYSRSAADKVRSALIRITY